MTKQKRTMFSLPGFYLVLSLALTTNLAHAELQGTFKAMNQPQKPFHLISNIYYVGASDVTSYLITTPQGHILLDCGFVETVPYIKENLKALGFKIEDIKILIISHPHVDHAGGMAELKKLTGAKLLVGKPDAGLLAKGGLGDIHFGNKYPFPPAKADQLVQDNDEVKLGDVVLKAHLTPGHTPGNLTWTMQVKEDNKTYNAVFAGSVTAPGYKLINNPACPAILADFEHSFAMLKSLPCDIYLAPHGSFFGLQEKFKRLEKGEKTNPFIDPQGYKNAIQQAEKTFQESVEKQKKQ